MVKHALSLLSKYPVYRGLERTSIGRSSFRATAGTLPPGAN